jgi:hypothetical protein
MAKKSFKSALAASIVLAMFACTNSIPDNPTVRNGLPSIENFQDLDKEYVFSTKALTQAYLKRKLNTWLCRNDGDISISASSCPYDQKLVKEINYARYKHSELFCAIIQDDPGMLDDINAVQAVQERKESDPSFSEFLGTCIVFVPIPGEFNVNTSAANDQKSPDVAANSSGDFVIVWSGDGSGDDIGIFAQRFNSDSTLNGSEFRVNTYTTNKQYFPSVAMDNNGDFVVSWDSYQQDGFNYGVYAQRYNNFGVAQGSEFLVNTTTTRKEFNSSVAMDSIGDFVITWEEPGGRDGYGYGIYAQRYNSGGVPQGSEFQVNTTGAQTQRDSSVAMDFAGDFVVTWMSYGQDGSRYGIYAQRYNSDGSKPAVNGSEFLVNTIIAGGQTLPAVAMDADGDFVVSWEDYSNHDGSGSGIFARRYNSSGDPQGAQFTVNSNTMSIQWHSDIAMDYDGDFVVTWESYQYGGSFFGTYAQRYNSDGSKPVVNGGEFLVNTITTNSQKFPAAAMDDNGDFVITWANKPDAGSTQDGSGYSVSAARYNANGDVQ